MTNGESNPSYWLVFLPYDGIVTPSNEQAQAFAAQYRIRLAGNPEGNPQFIENAIRQFEIDRGVNSWKELAISYEVRSTYFP